MDVHLFRVGDVDFVVIRVFIDNFQRQDHGGFAKAMWTILIIFIPVIGVAAYFDCTPEGNRGHDLVADVRD